MLRFAFKDGARTGFRLGSGGLVRMVWVWSWNTEGLLMSIKTKKSAIQKRNESNCVFLVFFIKPLMNASGLALLHLHVTDC